MTALTERVLSDEEICELWDGCYGYGFGRIAHEQRPERPDKACVENFASRIESLVLERVRAQVVIGSGDPKVRETTGAVANRRAGRCHSEPDVESVTWD